MTSIYVFEVPVAEREVEAMCAQAASILETFQGIPQDELNDGDIMLGQLAENVQALVHAVPLPEIAEHRLHDVTPVMISWVGAFNADRRAAREREAEREDDDGVASD